MNKEDQKKFFKDITKLFLYGKTADDALDYQELIKKGYETATEELKKTDKDFEGAEFKTFEDFAETKDTDFYKNIDALIDAGIDIESLILDYIEKFSQIKNPELVKNGFDPKGLSVAYEKLKTKFSAHNANDEIIQL